MEAPESPGYREAPRALDAAWTVEKDDLHAAAKALPGSTLALVRWPIAFVIAYFGVGLADPRVGARFALGSAAVLAAARLVVSLRARGTAIAKVARLPANERASRLSIDRDGVRLAAASGHVGVFPLADLTHAKVCPAGVLLSVRGQVVLVPSRAIRGSEEAWRDFVARLPPRAWPRGVAFTAGLWLCALLVAMVAYLG